MKPYLEKFLWEMVDQPVLDEQGQQLYEVGLFGRLYPLRSTARDVTRFMLQEGMIKHERQVLRTLEKWERRCKWESGVSIWSGWKRDPGTCQCWHHYQRRLKETGSPFLAARGTPTMPKVQSP